MLLKRLIAGVAISSSLASSESLILTNQIGYEQFGPKNALIDLNGTTASQDSFQIIDAQSSVVFRGAAGQIQSIDGWSKGPYQVCNFGEFNSIGVFTLRCGEIVSEPFTIAKSVLVEKTLSDAVSFFTNMRNNNDDSQLPLYGSTNTLRNVNGGWNDATGDRGKYLSHLAFSNYLSPQQIPMVVWSLLKSAENPNLSAQLKSAINDEAVWGADYLTRILDPEGFFYMIVFDRWGWDEKREICTWIYDPSIPEEYLRNGKKTANYQSAFREGGGIAIAALARASFSKISSASDSYLSAAIKAYAHLKSNNQKYCDDGKENIIDKYCALMAAVELYRATSESVYLSDAHSRASALISLISEDGFFWSDSAHMRPFYHAADEGLPIVALLEYLDVAPEKKTDIRTAVQKIWHGYENRSFSSANPYSYLKLVFSESNGSGGVGANLALNKTVTVSRMQSGYPAQNVCDGNLTSRWASGEPYSDTEWVIIDLGNQFEISSVACSWESAYGKEYEIQISSDKSHWQVAASITNDGAGRKVHSFDPVEGQYVKMQGKLRGITYGFSLYEFEVFGYQKQTTQPVKANYFMPHVNETGYWWQGENARLASLASAAYLCYISGISVPDKVLNSAFSHLDWILGKNPFGVCMLFGHGKTNYPDYPGKAGYTLINVKGGICNGVTGDTSGSDFPMWKPYEDSNTENWRWIEQWLPHNAWFILAVSMQGLIDWENRIPVLKFADLGKSNTSFKYRITGNKIFLTLNTHNKSKGKIFLRSLSGQLIKKAEFKTNNLVIPIDKLSNGMYIISIYDSGLSSSYPVMISK